MSSKKTILDIRNLTISLQSKNRALVKILRNINLKLLYGKTTALLGESGCGKTMTAWSILNSLPHNVFYSKDSEIIYNQKNLLNYSKIQMRAIRGNEIAMIYQEPAVALNPTLKISIQINEILLKTQKIRLNNNDLKFKAISLLRDVKLKQPELIYQQYPHQLSGGMKQRVMIAMALAANPKILLADEPTTALDVDNQWQILTLLREIQRKHRMSILLITHNVNILQDFADDIAVMYAGQIIEQGSMQNILHHSCHPYTKMLLKTLPSFNNRDKKLTNIPGVVPKLDKIDNRCSFLSRCIFKQKYCYQHENIALAQIDKKDHYSRCYFSNKLHIIEKDIDFNQKFNKKLHLEHLNVNKNNITQKVLSLKNLNVKFIKNKFLWRNNYQHIVHNVSFDLCAGKTVALVGESGSGKSTIAKAIMKLVKYTADYISTYDNNVQIIFQDPFAALNPRLHIVDILKEAIDTAKHKYYDGILTIIDELLLAVNLDPSAKYNYPHQFSGGQRQRICIARALATKPKIIICDEPTSALDISVQATILNLLKSLQIQQNLAYLFISHDLNTVSYLADYIIILQNGHIVEHNTTENILYAAQHDYTRKLVQLL